MVAPVAPPGLQDAEHANLSAQQAPVLGQPLQSRGRRRKQQRIDRLRLLAGESTQLGRQRKGDQKGADRQQQRQLLGEPGLAGLVLTSWAVAVATGVRAVAGELTGRAGAAVQDLAAEGLLALIVVEHPQPVCDMYPCLMDDPRRLPGSPSDRGARSRHTLSHRAAASAPVYAPRQRRRVSQSRSHHQARAS
jgi:hypothetical protein